MLAKSNLFIYIVNFIAFGNVVKILIIRIDTIFLRILSQTLKEINNLLILEKKLVSRRSNPL